MDRVIVHRVMSILAEMGHSRPVSLVDDFDPRFSIKNYGSHRLYEFHLEIRDDVEPESFISDFRTFMNQYNAISNIKADFCGASEYPGPAKNLTTVYLTVAAI